MNIFKMIIYWIIELVVGIGVIFFMHSKGLPLVLDIIVGWLIMKIMEVLMSIEWYSKKKDTDNDTEDEA